MDLTDLENYFQNLKRAIQNVSINDVKANVDSTLKSGDIVKSGKRNFAKVA